MSAGLVRGAVQAVLEPVEPRWALAVPAVVVAGESDGAAAALVAARIVRALAALGLPPRALVVTARARQGSVLDADEATLAANEPARLLSAAGASPVHWLRAHPASVSEALRGLAGSLEPDRPLVIVGALALAVLEPRLSVLVTGPASVRSDPQARAVERLFTVSLADPSDLLVAGLARLLAS